MSRHKLSLKLLTMKIINQKSGIQFIAFFFAMTMMFYSCQQYEALNIEETNTIMKNTDTIESNFINLQVNLQGVSDLNERQSIYDAWISTYNYSQTGAENFQNNKFSNFQNVISELENDGRFSSQLINAYANIETNLNSSQDFQYAVNAFENESSSLELSVFEQEKVNLFLDTSTFILNTNINQNAIEGDCNWWEWTQCGVATATLAAEVADLTALIATGVGAVMAVVGYLYTAVVWLQTCDPCLSR